MAWQTYDPKTGKTTNYTGNTRATKGAVVSVTGGVNKPVIQKETMIKPAPTRIEGGNLTEKTVTKAPVVESYQYGGDVLDKKANNASVNTLYNSYIGRDASTAELSNWGVKGGADTTVKSLENFLKGERKKYNITDPIKQIGTIKSEYQKMTNGEEDIVTETVGSGGESNVPTETTDQVGKLETQVGSLQTQLETLKVDQVTEYDKRKVEAETRMTESREEIKRLQDLQKETIDEADPTKQEFYDQETRILKNQLDAAELASSKLEEDFNKARALTDELNELNKQANSDIQAVKNQTGLSALLNPRINKTIDDYTGRTAVIQAAMAGVDNNISLSYQYIDKAQEDLTTRKNEEINYYNSVISFYEKLEVGEEKRETLAIADKKDAAQNIIDMRNTEINNLEDTTNYIKELMLEDPIRTSGAGINLATDNLDTITKKLADYDYGQEVISTRNKMEDEGYTYLSNMNGITSEDEVTRMIDSKGVERVYKNPVGDVGEEQFTLSSGQTRFDAKGNVIARGASKVSDNKTSIKSFKFSSDDIGRLIAVDFSNTDVQQIQLDINEFGVEKVVEGMDEKQANAIRNIAGGVTPTQEKKENEPKSVTAAKRKIIGNINALISDNASNGEIEEYISLKGYKKEDFSEQLKGYTPTVEESKWSKFWGFLTGN